MSYETRDKIDERIIKMYPYGSRVYGSHTQASDYDFIVVVESNDEELYYSVENILMNATVYSESQFIKHIKNHKIEILECIFQYNRDSYLEHFKLDTEKLRRAVSSVSSNSFVKCKKKLAQGEDYIGKKSMYHSLRILMFGIQIARYGYIVNYSEANIYYEEIMNYDNWADINKRFKPIFNELKTEFRKLAPLESEVIENA